SNNYIGLGVEATPNYPLEVAGNARFDNDLFIHGKVGIGTDNPFNKLNVEGNVGIHESGTEPVLLNLSKEASDANIRLVAGSPLHAWQIGFDGAFRLRYETNSFLVPFTVEPASPSDSVHITPNGIGLGTSNPGERLDVYGNVAISGHRVIDANGNWVGNPTG